jgi:hypothetical protein
MRLTHQLFVLLAVATLGPGCDTSAPANPAAPSAAATVPAAMPAPEPAPAPASTPAPPAPVSPIPGTLQAELATTKSGGRAIQRGHAQAAGVWHMGKGDQINFELNNIADAMYRAEVIFSNDDAFGGEDIEVLVDGAVVGVVHAGDSGPYGAGRDWDVFVVSPAVDLGRLSGSKTISLRVLSSPDGYGVDVDAVVVTTK